MDAQLPGVTKGAYLFGLAGGVLGPAVLDVALLGEDQPLGAELDAALKPIKLWDQTINLINQAIPESYANTLLPDSLRDDDFLSD